MLNSMAFILPLSSFTLQPSSFQTRAADLLCPYRISELVFLNRGARLLDGVAGSDPSARAARDVVELSEAERL